MSQKKQNPAFLRFKQLGKDYLITNDFGNHVFLLPQQFQKLIAGKLTRGRTYETLVEKGFIKDKINWAQAIMRYQKGHVSLLQGTSLHIMVVTLRCDTKCVYCQASSRPMNSRGYDMDKKTAKKIIDFIFQTPSPTITIEFQGGEPLANWPVVKFVVEYARKKEKSTKKHLFIGLVSNFNMMTQERLDFLMKNYVGMCTSLDGPEFLHNLNRPFPNNNSYQITTKWIKKIQEITEEQRKTSKKFYELSALVTISKQSLQYPKEIIDEYLKHGFRGIHLRPLNYLGSAQKSGEKIGYSTQEFLNFWRKSMDYILSLNLKGTPFLERGTMIILEKILKGGDPGYADLRSPCGATISQMLYNYDGKIYTCDEGRMREDDSFMIGDINHKPSSESKEKAFYENIVSGEKVKTVIVASTLDNSPCDYCVYKPYCGVCPVLNYIAHENLTPQIHNTDWCQRHQGIFYYIFEKLKNKKTAEIFKRWVKIND